MSVEQAELAQERVDAAGVADHVEVAVRDYRDQTGHFDAVVSVEMIEAVGEEFWPEYFSKIDSLLAPGGTAAIQAILMSDDRMKATRNTYTWMHKYIFPGGMLPSREAIHRVLQRHTSLRITNTASMGLHYAHTLRLWREQFVANWRHVRRARLRRPVLPDVGVLPGLLRGRVPHRLPRRGPDPDGALNGLSAGR